MSEYDAYEEIEPSESLLAILDEITVMVENAKSVPLSSSILLNRNELLELLHNAVEVLPSQLVAAHNVLQEKIKVSDQARNNADRIIAEAREQAKHIISQAKAQAQGIVARDSITVKARRQAAQIVDEAKSKANKITSGANNYSDTTLAEVATQLSAVQEYVEQIQVQIEAGRDVLAQRRESESQHNPEQENEAKEQGKTRDTLESRIWEASKTSIKSRKKAEENEYPPAEPDFSAVQAAYARAESQSQTFAHGGEINLENHGKTNPSENDLTAETAAVPAENESLHTSVNDLQKQKEKLSHSLPEDFDEFVPELEFEQYHDDYKA